MSNDYRKTDEECAICEGTIYKDGTERFCSDCSETNIGDSVHMTNEQDKWEKFHNDRPTYHTNDNVKKCIGGFLEPYEWGDDDDGIFRY